MQWQPAHEAHAIERVSLTFQFVEAAPSKPWQSVLDAATKDLQAHNFSFMINALSFPEVLITGAMQGQQPGLSIEMSPGGLITQHQLVTGRTFRILEGTSVREEIQIHRDRLVHQASVYDGWKSYKSRTLTLLGASLDKLLPLVDLANVKLEYWDRFVFDGDVREVDYSELLRSDSAHLPGFPFGTDRLWHSHVGYFTPLKGATRRLTNVNVDVLDLTQIAGATPQPVLPTLRRSVGIYTMAQDNIEPADSPSNHEGTLSSMDGLHAGLKAVFSDVITATAADRISLHPKALS